MTSVAILGLGLIGGSLGLALRRTARFRVVGVDRSSVIALSAARAAADELVDADRSADVRGVLEAADLCVLAAPVGTIMSVLPDVLAHARLVTDCGSTKRAICRVAVASPNVRRFVPGHPMAGLPASGVENARADLFEKRTWILCPEACDSDAVDRVEEVLAATGAKLVRMHSAAHDRAVARTSHVPQVLASALRALAGSDVSAAGPAFERATLTAGGVEAMWRDIFATNADEIALALGELEAVLADVRAGLSAPVPDIAPALAALQAARELVGTR